MFHGGFFGYSKLSKKGTKQKNPACDRILSFIKNELKEINKNDQKPVEDYRQSFAPDDLQSGGALSYEPVFHP